MHELAAVSAMARSLRALPDLSARPTRASAYLAAGVDANDIARLDRYALVAETERRRLFPSPACGGRWREATDEGSAVAAE